MTSDYYEDEYDAEDYTDDSSAPAPSNRVSTSTEEVAVLRQEVEDLRAQVADQVDPAVQAVMDDHRKTARRAAELEALAESAARDPKTLAEMERIQDKDEFLRFMTDRGYKGGSLF